MPRCFGTPGKVNTGVVRDKLLEAIYKPVDSTDKLEGRFAMQIMNGTLCIGGKPFRTSALAEWQQEKWRAALSITMPNDKATLSPVKAVQLILGALPPGQWAEPEQLEAALQVFCFGSRQPSALKILEAGWEWGCLARHISEGKNYYRLPDGLSEQNSEDNNFSAYLQPTPQGEFVLVDLRAIPFAMLEQVNSFARLEVEHNDLEAYPDPVKLGRIIPEIRQSRLVLWLREHLSAFRQMLDTIEERWGKVIVHSDLLVACIRNLSLRVLLERELGENLVVLSREYVAFPAGLRNQVERLLKKSGFVVKEVRA